MRVVLLCGLTIYILLSGLLSKCTNSSKITERRNMSGGGGGGNIIFWSVILLQTVSKM